MTSTVLAPHSRRGRAGAVVSSIGHAPHPSEARPAPHTDDKALAAPASLLRRDCCVDRSCDDRGWLRRRGVVVAVAIFTHTPARPSIPTLPSLSAIPSLPARPSLPAIASTPPSTASPTPSATAKPVPTAKPTPTATASPPPTPNATATPAPTATPTPPPTAPPAPICNAESFPDAYRRHYTEPDGDPCDLIESDSEPGDTRAIRELWSRFERDRRHAVPLVDPVGGRPRDRPCRGSVHPVSGTR